MAKRFHFDDEFEDDIVEVNNSTIEKSKENTEKIDIEEVEEVDMAKKKKKIKPWQIILLVFVLVDVTFLGYIFFLTNNDGPVFGNRCDGITAISSDAKDETITVMKDKYSDITDLTIEIVCKEVKVDITFKEGMSTKTAKKIAEETVKTLDENVGIEKDDGNTYSQLFGYIKNEAQYDCQLYLLSENSEDFPIYGTKHHSKDSFSYTYASVKDEDSKNKAEATLNDTEE